MKKTIAILVAILVISGICQSQASIKRKRDDKTEQTKPSDTEAKRQWEAKTIHNGHEYVDLGLPSGLKWATCNVGASSPSDYGNYYAWGETTTKSSYYKDNSTTYDMTEAELRSAGVLNSAGNLNMSYDAARANWGGSWRMPTHHECTELVYNCTWTWTSQGGHNGYRVTGPNGKSIFLPAAGWCNDKSFFYVGEYGNYWSSSCDAGDKYQEAISLYFESRYSYLQLTLRIYIKLSVRPVIE